MVQPASSQATRGGSHGIALHANLIIMDEPRFAVLWVGGDANASLAWASERSNPNEREFLLGRVAAAIAKDKPLEAANLAPSKMSDGPKGASAIVSVVYQWEQKDLAAAAAWVGIFPDDKIGKDAASNLAGIWAETDFYAASEWVATLTSISIYEAGKTALDQSSRRLSASTLAADQELAPSY